MWDENGITYFNCSIHVEPELCKANFQYILATPSRDKLLFPVPSVVDICIVMLLSDKIVPTLQLFYNGVDGQLKIGYSQEFGVITVAVFEAHRHCMDESPH